VIDVQKAGGAECARKSRKQKENEKGQGKREEIYIIITMLDNEKNRCIV
jgi:hypothetical protein